MSLEQSGIWAVDEKRIRSFFETSDCLGCEIEITPLHGRSFGSLTFPQTKVKITGSNSEILYARFRLEFLCGGG